MMFAFCVADSHSEPPVRPDNLSGIWIVTGEEKGKEYSGVCQIIRASDTAWQIDSVVNGNHSVGAVHRKGSVIVISWRSVGTKEVLRGVTILEMAAGAQSMSGEWTAHDEEGTSGTEKYTRFAAKK